MLRSNPPARCLIKCFFLVFIIFIAQTAFSSEKVGFGAVVDGSGNDNITDITNSTDSPTNNSGHADLVTNIIDPDCCIGDRGNFDGDPLDEVDIGDIVYMVEYQFNYPPGPPPPCLIEADISPWHFPYLEPWQYPDGVIDIADLVAMVEYQFWRAPELPVELPPCILWDN